MDAYVIIGAANTRKSSICRSLTGCFNRNKRNILTKQNDEEIKIYVRVSSLQESKDTPEQFYEETIKRKQGSVLFCLWPEAHHNQPDKFPDASEYMEYFQGKGWNIKKIAILGEVKKPLVMTFKNNIVELFPDTKSSPINLSALQVKDHFNWV